MYNLFYTEISELSGNWEGIMDVGVYKKHKKEKYWLEG